jgi:hypothetical protein
MLNKIFIYFTIYLIIVAFLFSYKCFSGMNLKDVKLVKKKDIKRISFDNVLGNNIFLTPFQLDVSLASIKEYLQVGIIEKRPDAELFKQKFDVKFKGFDTVLKVFENEKFYIEANNEGRFCFSNKITPLNLAIKARDEQSAVVTMEANLLDLNIDGFNQNALNSFVLSVQEFSRVENNNIKDEFQLLVNANWYKEDEFIKNFKPQDPKRNLQRLQIQNKIFHIKKDDLLVFKNGNWKIAFFEDTKNFSIAKVRSFDAENLIIDAWDKNANDKYTFTVFKEKNKNFIAKPEQLISLLRRRTQTYYSCQIEKQRVVLKEKDLFMKKDNLWRLVKKDVNLDDIKNESLFYVEKIEKRDNKSYLIGYLFNPMRTNFQKIETLIVTASNQKHLKKR